MALTMKSRGGGTASKGCGIIFFILFGAAFAGMGGFATYAIALKPFFQAQAAADWPSVQCTIQSSRVETLSGSDSDTYRPQVTYSYEWNGRQYQGDRYSFSESGSSDYDGSQQVVNRLQPGSTTTGYVNPANPSESVLDRSVNSNMIVGLIIGGIFVIIGLGIMSFAIWAAFSKEKPKEERALSTQKQLSPARKRMGMMVFGGLFVVVGLGLTIFLSVLPTMRWMNAQGWTPTDCTIITSTVKSHRSDDSTSYSIFIRYKYDYQGRNFQSARYNFFSGGSGLGYDSMRETVGQYPEGSTQTCYVNPADPQEAVLSLDFSYFYLLGLFGLIFAIPGLLVMRHGYRMPKTAAAMTSGGSMAAAPGYDHPADMASVSGTLELKPKHGRFTKFFGTLIFAIIWDAIVVFLGYQAFWEDEGMIVIVLFFVFGLVGLLITVFVPYQFLAMFNPRPKLRLTPGNVRLGNDTTLEWHIEGNVSRIGKITVTLEGEEEATYRQGTKTRTAKSVFHRAHILESDNPNDFRQGRIQFVMPEFSAPTFTASNNKIIWRIRVHGDIPKWPDVDEEYEVTVRPMALQR